MTPETRFDCLSVPNVLERDVAASLCVREGSIIESATHGRLTTAGRI
jgi:hypothetical protein